MATFPTGIPTSWFQSEFLKNSAAVCVSYWNSDMRSLKLVIFRLYQSEFQSEGRRHQNSYQSSIAFVSDRPDHLRFLFFYPNLLLLYKCQVSTIPFDQTYKTNYNFQCKDFSDRNSNRNSWKIMMLSAFPTKILTGEGEVWSWSLSKFSNKNSSRS